jgi:hypothetical protein
LIYAAAVKRGGMTPGEWWAWGRSADVGTPGESDAVRGDGLQDVDDQEEQEGEPKPASRQKEFPL